MANNYVSPALNVYQQVDDTVTLATDHLSTCLIGASYELYRYGYEEVPSHTYSPGTRLKLDGLESTVAGTSYSLDKSSMSLYGEGTEAVITPSAINASTNFSAGADPFVVTFAGNIATTSSASALDANVKYPVEIGDIIYYSGNTKSAKVVEVIYSGGVSKQVRTDSIVCAYSGVNPVAYSGNVTVTKPVDIIIDAEDCTVVPYSGVDHVKYSGQTVALPAYDLYAGYSASLKDNTGTIYASYRAEKLVEDESVIELTDTADVKAQLGTIAPENDLAYAAYCALKGSDGRTVYAVRTEGTTADDFTEACEKTDMDSSLYNFCAVTDDVKCMDAVTTFNASQSTPERKHWRLNFVGPKHVGEYKLLEDKTVTATIVVANGKAYVQDPKIGTTAISFKEIPLNGGVTSLHAGDKIKVGAATYTVDSVQSATTLTLFNGPATSAGSQTIELYKADTAENAAEYAASVASAFSSRRVVVTWADQAQSIDGVLDNKYIAATIAGMSSAMQPQAPMTRSEVPTVSAAPKMYTRYTKKSLDNVAASGVLVVTQDTKGGPCYIRHQLTTEMDKGVLYQELSITKNLDTISYSITDALETYVGRTNVTPSAIDAVRVKVVRALDYYTSNSIDDKIGAALGKYEDLKVYQDPTFLTRVIVKVKLYLPVPMNNIDVYLLAFAYDTTTGETTIEMTAA